MKIIEFKSKKEYGEKQEEVDRLFKQSREALVESLGLPNGFIVVFERRSTENYYKIMAMGDQPSDGQRGYYYTVVLPAIRKGAQKQGQHFESDEELHSCLKDLMMREYGLFVEKVNPITNRVYREPFSISNKKGERKNTAKFIESVINWASEFYSITIPETKK